MIVLEYVVSLWYRHVDQPFPKIVRTSRIPAFHRLSTEELPHVPSPSTNVLLMSVTLGWILKCLQLMGLL